jgi:putative PIN family toxin of toxin-antitoxin system
MRPDARLILDTNVIVSALAFPSSKPRQALDAVRERGRVLASPDTLGELVRTLRRPKLAAYITAAEREAFLEAFGATVELVEVRERLAVCRDPHDDKFLELAAAGGADYLVTGDADLLVMERFRGTAILAPAAFLERARGTVP